jgi:hypothetical protein
MAISFGVPFNFGKLESIWQVFYIPMNGGAYFSALANSQDGGYQSWEWQPTYSETTKMTKMTTALRIQETVNISQSMAQTSWNISENQILGVPNKSTVERAIMHPAAGSTVPICKFIHLDTIPGASWNQHQPWSMVQKDLHVSNMISLEFPMGCPFQYLQNHSGSNSKRSTSFPNHIKKHHLQYFKIKNDGCLNCLNISLSIQTDGVSGILMGYNCYSWWGIDGIFMVYLWDYPLVI